MYDVWSLICKSGDPCPHGGAYTFAASETVNHILYIRMYGITCVQCVYSMCTVCVQYVYSVCTVCVQCVCSTYLETLNCSNRNVDHL